MKKILFLLAMPYLCGAGNISSKKSPRPYRPVQVVVENKCGHSVFLCIEKKNDHVQLDDNTEMLLNLRNDSFLVIKDGYDEPFPIRIFPNYNNKRFKLTKSFHDTMITLLDNE